MIAKVNRKYTRRHGRFLEVMVELYPEPYNKSFFDFYHYDNASKLWKVYPMISYYLRVSPFINRWSMKKLIKNVFDSNSSNSVYVVDKLTSNPLPAGNIRKVSSMLEDKNTYSKNLNIVTGTRITETLVNLSLLMLKVRVGD